MSEVRMWEHLRDKVRGLVGIERVTEKLEAGVPDTVYCFEDGVAGWCELKFMSGPGSRWPSVKIPWKSPAQPFWLNRWARWGGRAGILLRIEGLGWFYWRAPTSINWVGWIQEPVDILSATWACGPELDVESLLEALH